MDYEPIKFDYDHEFTSFHITLQDVRLRFGSLNAEMHSQIEIIAPDGSRQVIESMWDRVGNLEILWPLLGEG